MAFWRSFFRRRMKPITTDHARKMKNRFSALYFLATWNLFGYAVYLWSKEATPAKAESEPSTKYYSKMLGLESGTVYHYRGLDLVEKFENPAPKERKLRQPVEDSENYEKTLPNEDLELLVEETGSL